MKKATLNAAEMKRLNRRLVLENVRRQSCSRIQLARQTGLTRAAISIIVDDLLLEGILLEGEAQGGRIGRKGILLTLNPAVFYVIGLYLSRSHFDLGLIDFCGRAVGDVQTRSISGLKAAQVLQLMDEAQSWCLAVPPPGQLLGMGISAPGPLDTRRGILLSPTNFADWQGFALADYFRSRLDCPVLLENNASALAIAEKSFGLGKDHDSFLEIIVDTGVGGGFVRHGEFYRGSSGFVSEVGHMTINFAGPACPCGNHGCAELYASIPNIVAYAQTLDPALTSWPTIVDEAAKGQLAASQVLDLEAEYLGSVIVNAVQILDVPAIVLYGDVCYRFDWLRDRISAKVNSRFRSRANAPVAILASGLTAYPITLTGANLVLEDYFSTSG